ncbi:MAG: hypothetical protein PHP42_12855 [Bacteroidota bacterium]|nr:hypothetical protein [Bacteroidota bacterium]
MRTQHLFIFLFLISSSLYSQSNISSFSDTTIERYDIQIRTVQGVTYLGKFISADDSCVTYKTLTGFIKILKHDILSVTKIDMKNREANQITNQMTKKIVIKEYDKIGLLLITVVGGIGTYALIKKSNDYDDEAKIYDIIRNPSSADAARNNSKEYLYVGIGTVMLPR